MIFNNHHQKQKKKRILILRKKRKIQKGKKTGKGSKNQMMKLKQDWIFRSLNPMSFFL
jgi:hypothetical protein